MNKHPNEVLVGNMLLLDYLATRHQVDKEENPLQERLETIIAGLPEKDQELFYLRFGEQLSFRQIAKRLGYASHMTFQVQLNNIMTTVREELERGSSNGSDVESDN